MQVGWKRRTLDLAIEVPDDELGAVAIPMRFGIRSCARLAELALEHRSTLVFVNTRRMVERLAFALSERIGEERSLRRITADCRERSVTRRNAS